MKKNVILAGAGVSLDPPANFPIAIRIINQLKQVIWPNHIELPKNDIRDGDINKLEGDFIRFEQLIDTLSTYDPELTVLDAVGYYQTPNLNHFNLAQAAIMGDYVITPNFDSLIEQAILKLNYIPKSICTENDFNEYTPNKGAVPVFKIHGSFFKYTGHRDEYEIKKETMQASLTSIAARNSLFSLSEKKFHLLKKAIAESDKLIIVGYSGSDDFDIIPSLIDIRPSHVVWIEHEMNAPKDHVTLEDKSEEVLSSIQKMASVLPGKENFLKHLADFGSTIEYYRLNTAAYLSALFGQKELPDEPAPTSTLNFEQHIKNWGNKLSIEMKKDMVARLYYDLSMYQEVLDIWGDIEPTSPMYIESLFSCAKCLDQLSRYKESVMIIDQLLQLDNIMKHPLYPLLLEKKAYVNSKFGEKESNRLSNQEIEALFLKAIDIQEGNNSNCFSFYNNYGLFLRDRNRISEAEKYYDLALKQAYEKGNLKYITWIMNNQATLLFDKGNFNQALAIGNEGFALSKKIGDYRQAGVFENLLANICFINGQIEDSIQYCKISIQRDIVLGNEPDSSVNWLLLGECYFEIEEYSEARKCYDKSLLCFDNSADKDFLYELRFLRLLLFLTIGSFENAWEECNQMEDNSFDLRETLFHTLAKGIMTPSYNFDEVLNRLQEDLNEIYVYINMVYYLSLLEIPIEQIGKKHIYYASDKFMELKNWNRYNRLLAWNKNKK